MNRDYCRLELEFLIRDGLKPAISSFRASTEEQIERQVKMITDLKHLTRNHVLVARAANLRRAWEKSPKSDPYQLAQVSVVLFFGTAVPSLVTHLSHLPTR